MKLESLLAQAVFFYVSGPGKIARMTQAMRMLLAEGFISREQYDRATLLQASQGGTLGYHLVASNALSDSSLVGFLTTRFPLTSWNRSQLQGIPMEVINSIPAELARSFRVLPLRRSSRVLTLGVTDPSHSHAIEEVSHYTKCSIAMTIVSEVDMTWAIEYYYSKITRGGAMIEDNAAPLPLVIRGNSSAPPDPRGDPSVPLPLTERVTSEYSLFGSSPTTANTGVSSIEDAINAIPLMKKTVPKTTQPKVTPTTKVQEPVAAMKPVVLRDQIENLPKKSQSVPAYDSWSKPASPMESKLDRNSDQRPTMAGDRADETGPQAIPQRTSLADMEPQTAAPKPLKKQEAISRKSEGEIIRSIGYANNRDDIIDLALEHMMRFSKRAFFLTVKKSEIRGFAISGELTSNEAIKSFWIPLSAPSTLSKVANEKQIHLGPLERTPSDAVLSASLGGRSERALIIPVIIQGRTVGLLYADKLEIDLPPWNRLKRLGEAVADAFSRLLSKGRSS